MCIIFISYKAVDMDALPLFLFPGKRVVCPSNDPANMIRTTRVRVDFNHQRSGGERTTTKDDFETAPPIINNRNSLTNNNEEEGTTKWNYFISYFSSSSQSPCFFEETFGIIKSTANIITYT